MRDHMPREKLNDEDRRALVLAALRKGNKTALGETYGVSRRWVHNLVEEAKEDPDGKFEDAVAEAAFRREVRDILAEEKEAGG